MYTYRDWTMLNKSYSYNYPPMKFRLDGLEKRNIVDILSEGMFPKRFMNQHTFFSQSGARDLNKANALAAASLASRKLVAGVSLAFGNVPCLTVAQFTILHSLFPQP